MSTLGGGGGGFRSGDTMMHVGDIMSTLGDVQYIRIFNINQRLFFLFFFNFFL